jgi:peptidoglycan/LPS O-acetylase OafA/YrhL
MLQPTADGRANNFGFLRLLFAVLVIVSHSPELIDGDRRREILTRMFTTVSFGELAVDGFFLISGFLITKSFVASPTLSGYLFKRAIRIIPAYLVSFWICIFFVAPFAGCGNNAIAPHVLMQQLSRNLLLLQPDVPGCYHSLRFSALNGSMWTISYEFFCYLLTVILGFAGLYRPRNLRFMVALVVALILIHISGYANRLEFPEAVVFGSGQTDIRFVAAYLVGSLFYLLGAGLKLTGKGALLALGLLLATLFHAQVAETSVMIFGGYLLFWFALRAPVLRMGPLMKVDISYGVYLYAWPIQGLLIRNRPDINPWLLCAVSVVIAGCAGYLSWVFVEKPALACVKRLGIGTQRLLRASP